MFTCLVSAFLFTASVADLPSLASEVEAEARALRAQTVTDSAYFAELDDFADDAMTLSTTLREAGITEDLPCIFRGISEDARARADELESAQGEQRAMLVSQLNALLDDAILLAPMAAGEVAARD